MVFKHTQADWDCRDIDVAHSNGLVHKRGHEDGLPNYHEQRRDGFTVTICQRCHPRIPGHLIDLLKDGTGIGPADIDEYFSISNVYPLFNALPRAYSSTGRQQEEREKIFRHAMELPMNPHPHHAGKTLCVALGYQWDIDKWQPDEQTIQELYEQRRRRSESKYSGFSSRGSSE